MKPSRALARQAQAHEATNATVQSLQGQVTDLQAQVELLAGELQAEREASANRHAELLEKLDKLQPKAK